MAIRESKGDTIFNIINYSILGIILICVLYPLYFMIIASFSDPIAVANGEAFLIPRGINFDGYSKIFSYPIVWIGYRNTIFYTVFATFFNVIVTMMLGYTLSRKVFSGKKFITIFILITMYFNGGLIPTYLVVKSLGLYNTWMVMIIFGMVNVFNVIITKTFLQNTIPEELYEAAAIDGCTHAKFFSMIALPLSSAIIAVLVLYYGMEHWNDFVVGMIYLSKQELLPLQIVLKNILLASQVSMDMLTSEDLVKSFNEAEMMKYALIIVSTIPVMIIYPFLQKYFVQGVMIGSVKG